MPGVLEALPQSDVGLNVSAAPRGNDGNAHAVFSFLPVGSGRIPV
jgi:hypothetical protein